MVAQRLAGHLRGRAGIAARRLGRGRACALGRILGCSRALGRGILARCLLALRLGGSALPAAGVAAIGAGRILAARCLGGCGRSGLRGRLARLCGGFPLTRGLLRLRGADLPFDDSSPAAPAVIAALCASFGYPVVVAYNTPFRAGHRVGQRLGRLDGRLYITLTLPGGRFRVGQNRVGDLLIDGATAHELVCLLKRVLPARFELVFILV